MIANPAADDPTLPKKAAPALPVIPAAPDARTAAPLPTGGLLPSPPDVPRATSAAPAALPLTGSSGADAPNASAILPAATPLANIGPRPVTTPENWHGADAANAAYAAADEARSLAAGKADDTNGYNKNETQEQLNIRRGLTLNPVTGAWDRPETAALPVSSAATPQSTEPVYSGPPLDAHGQLITPNTQSDGAGGFRSDVPLNGATGQPLGFSWNDINTQGIGQGASPGPATAPGVLPVGSSGSDAPNPLAGLPSTPAAPVTASSPSPQIPAPSGGASPSALPVSDPANSVNPAGVDRLALAKSNFENFANASDPYFQKSLRDANSSAAGAGQLGSGQLRTSLGDLAYNRDLQLNSAKTGFLNDATNNSVEDAYKNYGLGQQDQSTAFNQSVIQTQLEEALRNGDFSRASQLLSLGNQGNPSDTALQLSNNYGNQATAAGNAASGLVKNATANGSGSSDIPDWLKLLLSGGAGGSGGDMDWASLLNGTPKVGITPSAPLPPSALPIYQPSYPGGG